MCFHTYVLPPGNPSWNLRRMVSLGLFTLRVSMYVKQSPFRPGRRTRELRVSRVTRKLKRDQ